MSRLPLVFEPSEEVRQILQNTALHDGEPYNIMRMLAHNPRILKRANVLGGAYAAHGSIPVRAREIVILRVASHTKCDYELAQHEPVARAAGLLDDEIDTVLAGGVLDAAIDRTLLAMTDELLQDDRVSPGTWSALSGDWSPSELVELVTMVGFYRLLAGFLNSFEVPIDVADSPPV